MKLILIFIAIHIFQIGESQHGQEGGKGGASNLSGPKLPKGPSNLGVDEGICGAFSVSGAAFGPDLVKSVCDMAKKWLKGVKDIQAAPPQYRMILTPDQRKYWDTVVNCDDIQCLCDYWPKCRKHACQNDKSNQTELSYYSQRYGQSTRKDIRVMTPVERRRFFYALNKLKYDKIDHWSKFDILTAYHFFIPFAPVAHFSAGMLPFHREVLKNLEIALRMEHPLAAFPLWDTRLDAEMNNPKDTVLFTDELLGGGDSNVTTGPFQTWTGPPSNPNFPGVLYQGGLFRAFGAAQKAILYNHEYVETILAKPILQSLAFCTDPFLDTVHAATHLYIGGLMADPATSPGEPLFYLLHSFVDSIWEQWRQKHQTSKQRKHKHMLPCPYNPFDVPFMQLFPFPIKIKDAYSTKYTESFYKYQEQPTCNNDCLDSPMLVCKWKNGRCMSRIRVGGDCTGFANSEDPCYKSKCDGSKCVAS